MSPEVEVCGLVSKVLFYGVTWGTVAIAATGQHKSVSTQHQSAAKAARARRDETRRYRHEYQQLRLARLRSAPTAWATRQARPTQPDALQWETSSTPGRSHLRAA